MKINILLFALLAIGVITSPMVKANDDFILPKGVPHNHIILTNSEINLELNELKELLDQAIGEKNIKVNQVIKFAKEKFSRDNKVIYEFWSNQKNIEIYNLPAIVALNDHEEELTKLLEEIKGIDLLLKNSNFEYKNKVKDLLSPDEIDSYKFFELKHANEHYINKFQSVINNLIQELPELSDEQITNLNEIVTEFPKSKVESIPIGSSLSKKPVPAKLLGIDLMQQYFIMSQKIATILTPKQFEQVEKSMGSE